MTTFMSSFNEKHHTITLSEDGSFTAYSKKYQEHYHSTKDGALHESLTKHVEPAFKMKQHQHVITILDICYGLGFNTLATLYHYKNNNSTSKLFIYSPELDALLVKSLKDFTYPKEFDAFKNIIITLSEKGIYDDTLYHIEIFLGDAREFVKTFAPKTFDIVYHDPFSPKSNPMLWTSEYFNDVRSVMKQDGILTTYSIALATRIALFENGFHIYINHGEGYRDATIASLIELPELLEVDVRHKMLCNPQAKALRDLQI